MSCPHNTRTDGSPSLSTEGNDRGVNESRTEQNDAGSQGLTDGSVAIFTAREPLPMRSLQLSQRLGARVYLGRCCCTHLLLCYAFPAVASWMLSLAWMHNVSCR